MLRKQNRELAKENNRLKEENEFLAEASAFFAASRRALLVGLGVGGLFLFLWVLAGLLFPDAAGVTGPVPLILVSLLGGGISSILFAGGKKRRK